MGSMTHRADGRYGRYDEKFKDSDYEYSSAQGIGSTAEKDVLSRLNRIESASI